MTLNNRAYSALLIAGGTLALVCQLNPKSQAQDDASSVEVAVVSVDDRESEPETDHKSGAENSEHLRGAIKQKIADIEARMIDVKHEFAMARESGDAERAGDLERELDQLHHAVAGLRSELRHAAHEKEVTEEEHYILRKHERVQEQMKQLAELLKKAKEAGRPEDVEHIAMKIQAVKQSNSELYERAMEIQRRLKGMESGPETREARHDEGQRALAQRMELLTVSMHNLEKAGFPDLAHEVRMRAEQLEREFAVKEQEQRERERHLHEQAVFSQRRKVEQEELSRVNADLMEQMNQMKVQMQELQMQIQELREITLREKDEN